MQKGALRETAEHLSFVFLKRIRIFVSEYKKEVNYQENLLNRKG